MNKNFCFTHKTTVEEAYPIYHGENNLSTANSLANTSYLPYIFPALVTLDQLG